MKTHRLDTHRLVLEFSRADNAGEPHAYQMKTQTYNRRLDDTRYKGADFKWDTDLIDKIASLRNSTPDAEVVRRLGDTLRTFLEATGWSREEHELSSAVDAQRPVVVTIRSGAAELYHLPWELLTLGQTIRHLGALPDVLLRYEWPGITTKAPRLPAPRPEGGGVLFASSNAGGNVFMDKHLKVIQDACNDGPCEVLHEVSYKTLSEALEAAKKNSKPITVLHLLCHGGNVGGNFGLMLNPDKEGDPVGVDADRLANLLAQHADMIQLVVIAACDSGNNGQPGNHLGSVAQAIHRAGIAAVVASRYPFSNRGAKAFTTVFYRELLTTPCSVEQAFLRARNHLFKLDSRLFDWASIQLFAREADGDDTRPVVFRPYQGLLPLGQKQSPFFFGREEKVLEIITDLGALVKAKKPRFLVVQGGSGTGKSSMVIAGVIPKLCAPKNEAAGGPGDPDWSPGYVVATMKPGSDPERALKDALDGKQRRPVLLVVDQLEEIFTQTPEKARTAFAQSLWQLACDPASEVSVVLTMRSDFIGRCGEILLDKSTGRRLDAVANDEAYSVRVSLLSREQLREAIEKPAAKVGLTLERGLADRILDEIGTELGALPLVALTLDLLWIGRSGRSLTTGEYQKLGTVTGALCNHAGSLIKGLDDKAKYLAERLFVTLVGQELDVTATDTRLRLRVKEIRSNLCGDGDAGESSDTRLRLIVKARLRLRLLANAIRDKLRRGGAVGAVGETREQREERFDRMLEKLETGRLLVTEGEGDQKTVEVAHEVLLRRWEQLSQWRGHNKNLLEQEAELKRWLKTHKSQLTLLNERQIDAAKKFQKDYPNAFTDEAAKLLTKSVKHVNASRWIKRGAVAVISVLALGALVFALKADMNRNEANKNKDEAKGQAKRADDAMIVAAAGERLAHNDPVSAMQLLGFVENPDERKDWLRLTLETLKSAPVRDLVGHKEQISAVAWSPDGKWIATGSDDKTARLWSVDDPKTWKDLKGHRKKVTSVAWSPDGKWIATGSDDTTARVWSLDDTSEYAQLQGLKEAVKKVGFGADNVVLTVSKNGEAALWRDALPARGRAAPKRNVVSSDVVTDAKFSADGKQFVTVSNKGVTRIWDTAPLRERAHINTQQGHLKSVDFSGDASVVLTVGMDNSLRLWDCSNQHRPMPIGQPLPALIEDMDVTASSVVHEGNDKMALIGYSDGSALIWAPMEPGLLFLQARPEQGQSPVTAKSEYPIGSVRYQVLNDRAKAHTSQVTSILFRNDHILTASNDGKARLWTSVDKHLTESAVMPHSSPVLVAAFSPDSKHVVTVSRDKKAHLWKTNTDTTRQLDPSISSVTLGRHQHNRYVGLFISQDIIARQAYAELLSFGSEPPVLLRDSTIPKAADAAAPEENTPDALDSATISVDGSDPEKKWSVVVGVKQNGSVLVWRDKDPGPPVELSVKQKTGESPDLTEDGARVLLVSTDGKAQIHSTTEPTAQPIVFAGNAGKIVVATLSKDGQQVAAGTSDGDTFLWNVNDPGAPIHSLNRQGSSEVIDSVAFSDDGRRILVVSKNGIGRLWTPTEGSTADGKDICLHDSQNKCDTLGLTHARLSPDGSWVAALSRDQRALLWNVNDRGNPHVLGDPGVLAIAFNNRSDRVVTGSADHKARLWSVKGERSALVSELAAHASQVVWAEFWPNGKGLMTRSLENEVRAWMIDTKDLQDTLSKSTHDCLPVKDLENYLDGTEMDAGALHSNCERRR